MKIDEREFCMHDNIYKQYATKMYVEWTITISVHDNIYKQYATKMYVEWTITFKWKWIYTEYDV